jgi:hypothetical protein
VGGSRSYYWERCLSLESFMMGKLPLRMAFLCTVDGVRLDNYHRGIIKDDE